jgi:Protein of unknown function (DUF2628)
MIGYFLFGRERRCSYSVHEPPHTAADRVERAEALEFVKDGFEFPAFVLPPIWLASRGIWLGTLAYFAAVVVIFGLAGWLGVTTLWPALAMLVIHLIAGAEADELHRSHLEAQGWSTVGHVTGTGALDCERRFYDQWLPSSPMTRTAEPVSPSVAAPVATVASPRPQLSSIIGNALAPLRRGK